MQFDPIQEQAIAACCDMSKRIVAVTGKAGTGKTSIIREVEKRLSDAGYIVGCSAPTGKAARRIKELCGINAMTNHRMLGYGMPIEHTEIDEKTGEHTYVRLSTGPTYTRAQPMIYDAILCDEYAMVNHEIHRNLIDALKPGGRICAFGDVNQLKPIEEDRLARDEPSPFMIALQKFTGIELPTIHRQQEGSGIADNGALILAGRLPRKRDDFDIRMTNNPLDTLRSFVVDARGDGIDYTGIDNQIITCMNKSWIGTKKLNATLQSMFWERERPPLSLERHKYPGMKTVDEPIRVQVGTKVVYTANTYDLGNEQSVFNGETGIVVAINHDEGSLEIDLGDRIIEVPPILVVVRDNGKAYETDPRKNIDLAYALTTHKCQGSEFKHVCYTLNKSTMYGQSRRNFYTGITRAREHCTVITDNISFTKSVKYTGG